MRVSNVIFHVFVVLLFIVYWHWVLWYCSGVTLCYCLPFTMHEKQRSSQGKCVWHLSNLPSHRDNATHQGILISQPVYEDRCMECLLTLSTLVLLWCSITLKYLFACFIHRLQLPPQISQGFDTLLVHYSIHHFMNEEIVSCEREPYFDQSERGPYRRIQCFLIDKPCM